MEFQYFLTSSFFVSYELTVVGGSFASCSLNSGLHSCHSVSCSVKPHFRSSNSSEHAVEGPAAVSTMPMGDGPLNRTNSRNFVMERHNSTLTGHQDQGYSQKDSPTAQMEQNGDYGIGRGR